MDNSFNKEMEIETMSILQLSPPIPVVSPKGKGLAHFLIDYGMEHHLYWVVFIDDTHEIWTLSNTEIRADTNETYGRVAKKDLPCDHQFLPAKGIGFSDICTRCGEKR